LAYGASQLQDVNRFFHAQQDRTNCFGAPDFHQQLVGNVTGSKVREDQCIRTRFSERAEGIGLLLYYCVKRHIRLNVALDDKSRIIFTREWHRPTRLLRDSALRCTEARIGEYCNPGFDVEKANTPCREIDNLGQLLGGGIDIHRGVSKEVSSLIV